MVVALALLKVAVPFALLSCFSTPFELKHALKVTKTTGLFTTSQFAPQALPVAQEAGIKTFRIFGMGGKLDGHETVDGLIEKAKQIQNRNSKPRMVPKEALAFLFFSSGTTGLPKGETLRDSYADTWNSHFWNSGHDLAQKPSVRFPTIFNNSTSQRSCCKGQNIDIIRCMTRTHPLKRPTLPTSDGLPVVLAFLPMHHTFGFHIYTIRAFIVPTQFVIFRKWDTGRVLRAITQLNSQSYTLQFGD